MHRRYDFSNRRIASIEADSVGDNSAPRETNRQLSIMNEKQDQLMLLEFMRSRSCPAPGAVGGPALYMLDALKCSTEKIKGNYKAPECEMQNWKGLGAASEATNEGN